MRQFSLGTGGRRMAGAIRAGLSWPIAVALAVPGVAVAQSAAPAAEEEAAPAKDESATVANATGNAIVVTATKREQTLQNVAVAVAVVTQDTIQLAHIRDIEDLSTLVPSLRVVDHQSTGQTAFDIRGFGNGDNNVGVEPSVGVFIDNVYRSRSAAEINDFPDVAQVEVLRGPQSTLFGKNASAGVINILTDEPKFHPAGNAELSYGNYNAVIARGVITGPLSKDIAVSLAGGYNRRDGYDHDAGTGKDINNRNRWFVRGQLLYEPNTQLKVRLIADYSRIKELCCAVVNVESSGAIAAVNAVGGQVNAPAARYSDVIYDNFDPTNDIRDYGFSGQADYSLGPLTFSSITAWRKNRNISNSDADFSSADLLGAYAADVRIRTFTQEFRAATNMDGPINLLAGAFYSNEAIGQTGQTLYGTAFRPYANLLIENASGGALNVPALENLFGALQGNPAMYTGQFFAADQGLNSTFAEHDNAFSVYGQVDFKPIKRVTLTGGINYTHDGKRYAGTVQSTDVFSGLDLNALSAAAVSAGVPAAQAAQLLALKQLQFLPPFLSVPNAVEPGRTSDGDISWTARAGYDATDRIKLYANASTGFKPSSVNLSTDSRPPLADAAAIQSAGLAVVNQSYGRRFAGPEHSMLFEVGMKANWGIATLNFAAFRQYIKGFQSNLFNGVGYELLNAQKESVDGFEFEGTIRPVEPLLLSQSLTYLRPKYDQFTNSSFGNVSGTTPAGIPPLAFTAAATWDQPVRGGGHVLLRSDWHYESQTQIADGLPNEITTNPLTGAVINYQTGIAAARPFTRTVSEFDASLTWRMRDGLEFSAWGRNLSNDRYLTVIFDTPAQPGSVSAYTNQPRTYGLSARYTF